MHKTMGCSCIWYELAVVLHICVLIYPLKPKILQNIISKFRSELTERWCFFITNTSHLPLLWEMFTVQFENLMKPRHTPYGEIAGFFQQYCRWYLCINQLSAGESSLDVNNSIASQKIFHVLWNAKFHYYVHNSQPLVLALSQINLVYTLTLRSI